MLDRLGFTHTLWQIMEPSSLSFLIHKMELMRVPTSPGCYESRDLVCFAHHLQHAGQSLAYSRCSVNSHLNEKNI